jgi:integrase
VSVYRKCLKGPEPRDGQGRRVACQHKGCPWGFVIDLGPGLNAKGDLVKRRQHREQRFETKADAQAAHDKIAARVRAGSDVAPKATVGAWLDEWLEGRRSLRASTRIGYEGHLRDYLKPALGHLRLDVLRASHIAEMVAMIEAGHLPLGLDDPTSVRRSPGPTTIRRIMATLSSALNSAVKQQRITVNPARFVELPQARQSRPEPWTAQEVGKFLDAAATDRLGALFEVLAFSGLRRGEACGLRWVDVDLEAGQLQVVQQVTSVGGQLQVGPPKTKGSEHRTLELAPHLVGVLLEHRLRQDTARATWGDAWVDTGLVFAREDGSTLRPDYVTKRLVAIAKAAGLPPKRLHDLRHGMASLLIAGGVQLEVVSKILGHSQIATTSGFYSHMLPGVVRSASEAAVAQVPRRARDTDVRSGPAGDEAAAPGSPDLLAPRTGLEPVTVRLTVGSSAN